VCVTRSYGRLVTCVTFVMSSAHLVKVLVKSYYGFYSSLGPEVVFHVKTPCLLHCFHHLLVSGSRQTPVPNSSQVCSETIKKTENTIHLPLVFMYS